MRKQIGITREERSQTLRFVRELLDMAQRLRELPPINDTADARAKECLVCLVEEALNVLPEVYEIAEAEVQDEWTRDPRNPNANRSGQMGFVKSDDSG